MMTVRKDVLTGTPDEIARKLEQISKGISRHEYLAGTRLRALAEVLSHNTDLLVSVVTYENEAQELEVRLAASPGGDPIMIDRSSTGDHGQVSLNEWMKIGTEPDIENTAEFITALLSICADLAQGTPAPDDAEPRERYSPG